MLQRFIVENKRKLETFIEKKKVLEESRPLRALLRSSLNKKIIDQENYIEMSNLIREYNLDQLNIQNDQGNAVIHYVIKLFKTVYDGISEEYAFNLITLLLKKDNFGIELREKNKKRIGRNDDIFYPIEELYELAISINDDYLLFLILQNSSVEDEIKNKIKKEIKLNHVYANNDFHKLKLLMCEIPNNLSKESEAFNHHLKKFYNLYKENISKDTLYIQKFVDKILEDFYTDEKNYHYHRDYLTKLASCPISGNLVINYIIKFQKLHKWTFFKYEEIEKLLEDQLLKLEKRQTEENNQLEKLEKRQREVNNLLEEKSFDNHLDKLKEITRTISLSNDFNEEEKEINEAGKNNLIITKLNNNSFYKQPRIKNDGIGILTTRLRKKSP